MIRAVPRSCLRPDLPFQRRLLSCAALGLAFVLSGCADWRAPETSPAPQVSTTPVPRPARIVVPEQPIVRDQVTEYFASLEAQRLSNGLLRRERAPRDLPITARDIEETFVRIALYEEYTVLADRVIERETPSVLRRWEAPVRMQLEFGASVPVDVRRADTGFVNTYSARLGQLTGHSVTRVDRGGNFHVLVVNEAERSVIGPRLRQLVPGLDAQTVDLVQGMPLSVSCLVLAFSRTGTDVYTDALAVIRAELPDLSRRACFYEELAQGMGLPNDSPRARPSLFNDTAEFAVMTVLDEQILRVLYDPRLRPGMREREARPLVRQIANELMGGES